MSALMMELFARAGGTGNGTSAAPQAGILEGANPAAYNPKNPITLFIIQASIVIIFCQLLHYPLKLLGQPRVIAEVIGGIILGPSVMMRIPGFENAIFPPASMPVLNNVANLGLVIFLFIVALEVDIHQFTSNWKVAISVGLAGMVLPFGLGIAIAWGIYKQFPPDANINFGVFGLFIGTALAITAFPVLCRILTELNLLRSNVGVTVLAAGIGNDVTGWVLLALCVALVNNSSGLSALYALLACIAWTLALIYLVRPVFIWVLRRTGSLQNGPSQGVVALTLLLVLMSSFFTGIIGVHPIFGAFLAGLICPHDGGFALHMTEKIEDLISALFLPLYFALSGLNTNLGALNDGVTWGYVIGVIICAFAGKIIGGTFAARLNKLLWRESLAIGCLMSCKGLVELIVLNIGREAKILNEKTFTMFVVMALVTTVATTPLTKALYPPWYQKKVERWRRGEIDWDDNEIGSPSPAHRESIQKHGDMAIRRLLVYLRLDSLPGLFTFLALLGPHGTEVTGKAAEAADDASSDTIISPKPLEVHGLRIVELTDRTSSVMRAEGGDFYSQSDPVVNVFQTFSQLHDLAVAGRVAVAPGDAFAKTLIGEASAVLSDFALIPWGQHGSTTDDHSIAFGVNESERSREAAHLEFIGDVLRQASFTCNAGVFVDNGFGGFTKPNEQPERSKMKGGGSIMSHRDTIMPVRNKNHHIFLPFIGGADDRVALKVILQLANSPRVIATIVYMNCIENESGHVESPGYGSQSIGNGANMETIRTDMQLGDAAEDLALLSHLQGSLPGDLAGRVIFSEMKITRGTVLAEAVTLAKNTVGRSTKNAGDVVILGRRHAIFDGSASLEIPGNPDLKSTVGEIAEELINCGIDASLLIVQAGRKVLGA